MSMQKGEVLFQRGSASNSQKEIGNNVDTNDVWDDRELIKAYDRAVLLTYKQATETPVPEKKSLSTKQWAVGDVCYAPYEGDSLYYKARISSIDGHKAIIEYEDYGESATVGLDTLGTVEELEAAESTSADVTPSASDNEARSMSAANYNATTSGAPAIATDAESNAIPRFAPPIPPHFLRNIKQSESSEEDLAVMLTSWYMCGYHTGYYQGMLDARNRQN